MAIHRTHKQTDLEKRFKHLEFQLYGKERNSEVRNVKLEKEVRGEKSHIKLQSGVSPSSHITPASPTKRGEHSTSTSDVTYLKQDLTKIAIFAAIAISVQFLIYFGQLGNIVKLF